MKTRVIEEGQRPAGAEPSNVVPPRRQPGGAHRVLLLVFGGIALVVALGLLAGGGVALWALGQRDDSGYFTTDSHRLSTPSYAIASKGLDIGPDAPGWISDFAGVRIQAGSERAVFLGIGPTSDVTRYLARVQHSQITDFDTDPVRFSSREVAGSARPAPPAQQGFWRVRATGSGTQTVTWPLEKGNWSAVAMNADGLSRRLARLTRRRPHSRPPMGRGRLPRRGRGCAARRREPPLSRRAQTGLRARAYGRERLRHCHAISAGPDFDFERSV